MVLGQTRLKLRNMTDSTWIFCLRNAFACLVYNHPQVDWGIGVAKRGKKSFPYLLERNTSTAPIFTSGSRCSWWEPSSSSVSTVNKNKGGKEAHSSNPENCKHGKGRKNSASGARYINRSDELRQTRWTFHAVCLGIKHGPSPTWSHWEHA